MVLPAAVVVPNADDDQPVVVGQHMLLRLEVHAVPALKNRTR